MLPCGRAILGLSVFKMAWIGTKRLKLVTYSLLWKFGSLMPQILSSEKIGDPSTLTSPSPPVRSRIDKVSVRWFATIPEYFRLNRSSLEEIPNGEQMFEMVEPRAGLEGESRKVWSAGIESFGSASRKTQKVAQRSAWCSSVWEPLFVSRLRFYLLNTPRTSL